MHMLNLTHDCWTRLETHCRPAQAAAIAYSELYYASISLNRSSRSFLDQRYWKIFTDSEMRVAKPAKMLKAFTELKPPFRFSTPETSRVVGGIGVRAPILAIEVVAQIR